MPTTDGGLGTALVGEKIVINSRSVAVTRLLGEGKAVADKRVAKGTTRWILYISFFALAWKGGFPMCIL